MLCALKITAGPRAPRESGAAVVSRGSDATTRAAKAGRHSGRMELNIGRSAAEMIATAHSRWRSAAARFRRTSVSRNAAASIAVAFTITVVPLSLLLRLISRFDPAHQQRSGNLPYRARLQQPYRANLQRMYRQRALVQTVAPCDGKVWECKRNAGRVLHDEDVPFPPGPEAARGPWNTPARPSASP